MKKVLALFLSLMLTASAVVIIPSAVSDTSEEEGTTVEPHTDSAETTQPGLKENEYYLGDCNHNGTVTAADARFALRYTAFLENEITNLGFMLADINKDSTLKPADARLILRIAAELDKPIIIAITPNDELMKTRIRPATEAPVVEPVKEYKDYPVSLYGFSTNIRDPDCFEYIAAIENIVKYYQCITFYYTDVNRKFYIAYNPDAVFRTQCTIKAPYVKVMLEYMEQHGITLNDKLTLYSSQKWPWGSFRNDFASGASIPIDTIIRYTLRYSDNSSYQMLFDYFGNGIFNQNAAKLGVSTRLGSYIFGECSARDMAALFLDIYNYNGIYRDYLFNEMHSCTNNMLIPSGIDPEYYVMHKWGNGGARTVGYHDCAIILAEPAFVLTILSSMNMTNYSNKQAPFIQIAQNILDVHETISRS